MYATDSAADAPFGALHNAYAQKWTGSGVFHPPHGHNSAQKALRWAVSSTYESKPTFNIGVLVCPPGTKLKLIEHERVQVLLHLNHRRHKPPLTEPTWYMNMRMQYKMPKTWDLRIVAVANDTGLSKYADSFALRGALRAAAAPHRYGWPADAVQDLRSNPMPGSPLPITKAFQKAAPSPEPAAQAQMTTTFEMPDQVLAHAPKRRFDDKDRHWYTDGSKSRNKKLTAAVVKALEDSGTGTNIRVTFPDDSHDLRLHTSVMAEHAALATAVREAPADQPITIFTDSLTSIWNIKGMLENPKRYRNHKHQLALSEIAQTLRTKQISIRKVRAHSGIAGNEMADSIAAGKVTCGQSKTYEDNGEAGRGLAWILYIKKSQQGTEGPQEWAVNDLTAHPLRVANEEFNEKQWHEARTHTTGAIAKLCRVHKGGINEDITYSYWKRPHLQKYRLKILRARCNRTWTQVWQHRVLPAGKRPASARCQLCRKDVDETAQHSMEECTFGPKMVLRKARHDTAALAPITEAIRTGKHSGCYIHVDGMDSLNPHDINGSPSKALMAWLRGNDYQQSSFPDIAVVVGRDNRGNYVPCEGRPAIYLVEIKYTEDCNVHAVAQGIAMRQHSRLLAHLRSKWPQWTVEVLPLVFGSVGTVRTETERHLETLGVDKQALSALLQTVHDSSIDFTMQILNVHKQPSRYATITETRQRKAKGTSKRQARKKKPKRTSDRQQSKDYSDELSCTAATVSDTQPCHPMRTRSCKRNAHDADMPDNAADEQQPNRKRRTMHDVHQSTTCTVSNVAVNDADEFHIVICRTKGCEHRPSPRKRTQQHDANGLPPKKRICCTMCACVTALQVPDARPHPREPD